MWRRVIHRLMMRIEIEETKQRMKYKNKQTNNRRGEQKHEEEQKLKQNAKITPQDLNLPQQKSKNKTRKQTQELT